MILLPRARSFVIISIFYRQKSVRINIEQIKLRLSIPDKPGTSTQTNR